MGETFNELREICTNIEHLYKVRAFIQSESIYTK